MSWYLDGWKTYAVFFAGRSRRKAYWFYALFNGIVLAVLLALHGATQFSRGGDLFTGLAGLYWLATLLPSLSLTVRRIHDIGRSGWWIFVSLIPVIGGIVLLVFLVLDSQPGNNAYGPNPKAAAP